MTSSPERGRILTLGRQAVHAWRTGDGAAGTLLLDTEEATVRPCTPQGLVTGRTVLRDGTGTRERPPSDPAARHAFLVAASALPREWRRGAPPERITRTYW